VPPRKHLPSRSIFLTESLFWLNIEIYQTINLSTIPVTLIVILEVDLFFDNSIEVLHAYTTNCRMMLFSLTALHNVPLVRHVLLLLMWDTGQF
jgi:hypothetical protein